MSSQKLTLFLPSLEGGGAERVFVQLANRFAAMGVSVDLVLATGGGPYRTEVSAAVRLVDLGATRMRAVLPGFLRYLKETRPVAVLSALDHANIVSVMCRFLAPAKFTTIVSMRSVPTAVYRADKTARRWLMLQLIKVLYPKADLIIANSGAVKQDLVNALHIAESKIAVIYNPLDISQITELSRKDIDHPWADPGAPPYIVAVGSLKALKDFPTLIRAFAIVRQQRSCRLIILGEGEDRSKLEAMVRSLDLENEVLLPGFVNNPFNWIRRATLFVSSSLTEGCPNAIMQALACNTPVVSTDGVGGASEILSHGKWGRLVPTGNDVAMAEAILEAFESVEQPDTMRRANDFALEQIAGEYLRLLLPDFQSPPDNGEP